MEYGDWLYSYSSILSHVMNHTLIVVAAVLHREGKLLIGQRMANDRHGLKWEFPGGKVEIGESPKEALARELREELAIDAVVGREIARYEQATRRRSPLLLLFHSIDSYVGEPQGIAFEQIRWEDPAKLPEYDFLDGDLDFVRRLAMGRLHPFA
jgi:8-oxo-dGTP diphosphatase